MRNILRQAGRCYLPLGDFAKSQVNREKHTQTIDKIRVYTYVQSGAFSISFIFAVRQGICYMAGELRCLRLLQKTCLAARMTVS